MKETWIPSDFMERGCFVLPHFLFSEDAKLDKHGHLVGDGLVLDVIGSKDVVEDGEVALADGFFREAACEGFVLVGHWEAYPLASAVSQIPLG